MRRARLRPASIRAFVVTLAILVADGARPDTLAAAIDRGDLPALAALRGEGDAHTITSVFPSVTGPAYVPFLMGLHPGPAGIPGIRWWDRAGARAYAHGTARSYMGFEALRQDGDLIAAPPTLFELAQQPLATLTPIGRGLPDGARLGAGVASWPRMAWTHFRGDVRGWLDIERTLTDRLLTRVARERPDFVFVVHPGIDKLSHHLGHHAPAVLEAMRLVDDTVARLAEEATRRGAPLELMVVSDHGHAPIHSHEDLAGTVAALGHGVLAHPWTFAGGEDVAVMVSGNAMAHLYLELGRRERPWWPALGRRWESLVHALLQREAVDLLLLPHGPSACEIRARGRGAAMVQQDSTGCYAYRPIDGDPLGLSGALGPAGSLEGLHADDAHAVTLRGEYPDALVQVIALAGAARAGEIIVSASPGWDLRARWEPIPHRSSHGSLRREHLLVPLLRSSALVEASRRTGAGAPRRTVDTFAMAHSALKRS